MNLADLHTQNLPLETSKLFEASEGKVIHISLQKNGFLKEHITKVPAFLVCISGETVYEDENNANITLKNGDYVNIEANVKHWLVGIAQSSLILIK
jgi:quercetin dioxygenase-like cupin family protein